MTTSRIDASLDPGHVFPTPSVGQTDNCDELLEPVRQKPLDSLRVLRRYFVHLVKHAPGTLRLLAAQVGLAALGAHDLPSAGDLEAARSLLVCLHLRHDTVLFPVIPRDPTAPLYGAVSHNDELFSAVRIRVERTGYACASTSCSSASDASSAMSSFEIFGLRRIDMSWPSERGCWSTIAISFK
jgi:hypothetical protein